MKTATWPLDETGRAKMVSELSQEEFAVQYEQARQACLRALKPAERVALLDRRDGVFALRSLVLARMVIINASRAARSAKPAKR